MSEFVLIVLVTMGLTKEPTTFEIRLPKDVGSGNTYSKSLGHGF